MDNRNRRNTILRLTNSDETSTGNFTLKQKRISFKGTKSVRTFDHENEATKFDRSYEVSDHVTSDNSTGMNAKLQNTQPHEIDNNSLFPVSNSEKPSICLSPLPVAPLSVSSTLCATYDYINKSGPNCSQVENSVDVTLYPFEQKIYRKAKGTATATMETTIASDGGFYARVRPRYSTEYQANDRQSLSKFQTPNNETKFKNAATTTTSKKEMETKCNEALVKPKFRFLSNDCNADNAMVVGNVTSKSLEKTNSSEYEMQVSAWNWNAQVSPSDCKQTSNYLNLSISMEETLCKPMTSEPSYQHTLHQEASICGQETVYGNEDISIESFHSASDIPATPACQTDAGVTNLHITQQSNHESILRRNRDCDMSLSNDLFTEIQHTDEHKAKKIDTEVTTHFAKTMICDSMSLGGNISQPIYGEMRRNNLTTNVTAALELSNCVNKVSQKTNIENVAPYPEYHANRNENLDIFENNNFAELSSASRVLSPLESSCSPLISSAYVPHYNKKLNLRQFSRALESGTIQIVPESSVKKKIRNDSSLFRKCIQNMENKEAIKTSKRTRLTLNFDESENENNMYEKNLFVPKGPDAHNDESTLCLDNKIYSKTKNYENIRFSQADEKLLDNTSYLAKAKLGDETASRNNSKAKLDEGETTRRNSKRLLVSESNIILDSIKRDEEKQILPDLENILIDETRRQSNFEANFSLNTEHTSKAGAMPDLDLTCSDEFIVSQAQKTTGHHHPNIAEMDIESTSAETPRLSNPIAEPASDKQSKRDTIQNTIIDDNCNECCVEVESDKTLNAEHNSKTKSETENTSQQQQQQQQQQHHIQSTDISILITNDKQDDNKDRNLNTTIQEDSLIENLRFSRCRILENRKSNTILYGSGEDGFDVVPNTPMHSREKFEKRQRLLCEGTPHRSMIEFEEIENDIKKSNRGTINAVRDMSMDMSGLAMIENTLSSPPKRLSTAAATLTSLLRPVLRLPASKKRQTLLFSDESIDETISNANVDIKSIDENRMEDMNLELPQGTCAEGTKEVEDVMNMLDDTLHVNENMALRNHVNVDVNNADGDDDNVDADVDDIVIEVAQVDPVCTEDDMPDNVRRSFSKIETFINETANCMSQFYKESTLPLARRAIPENQEQNICVQKRSIFEENPITISDVSVHFAKERKSMTNRLSSVASDAMENSKKRKMRQSLQHMLEAINLEGIEDTKIDLVESILDDDDDYQMDADFDQGEAGVAGVQCMGACAMMKPLENITAVGASQDVCAEGTDGVLVEDNLQKNNERSPLNGAICRKCRNCKETICDMTTDEPSSSIFVMPEMQVPELNFERLLKLQEGPDLNTALDFWQNNPVELAAKAQDDAAVSEDELDSVDQFIEQARMKIWKLENEMALSVRQEPFVTRLQKLLSHDQNWIFNYQQQYSGVFLFHHTKLLTLHIVLVFEYDDRLSKRIRIHSITLQPTDHPKRFWSPIDHVIDYQMKLQTPSDLQLWCASNHEESIRGMLNRVNDVVGSVISSINDLRRIVYVRHSAAIISRVDGIFIEKIVRKILSPDSERDYRHVGKRRFCIELLDLRTISFKNITLPPLSQFKDYIENLPTGLDFVNQFLENPEKYMLNA